MGRKSASYVGIVKTAVIYKVLIASPGDVSEERDAVREAIDAWNSAHSDSYGVYLRPVRWELDATPEMGGRPQEIVNRQIVEGSDILIGVFWTRLGTPTGEAESGTAEEVERFRSAGKPVLLYFSHREIDPSEIAQEQYAALLRYREKCEAQGLISAFRSVGELREQLQGHITKTVARLRRASSGPQRAGPLTAESASAGGVDGLELALASSDRSAASRFHRFTLSVCRELEETRPDFGQFGEIDEAVLQQIDAGAPVSARFAQAADVAAGYDFTQGLSILYKSFGQMLGLTHLPDGFSGPYHELQFDGFRFLLYEMFVSLIAVLVKAEKWTYLAEVLSNQLFDESEDRGGYKPFARLNYKIASLDDIRNRRLELNRRSVVADLLKQRFVNRPDMPVNHSEFMSADYFLFLRTVCSPDDLPPPRVWRPHSCLYLRAAPQFVRKCESRAYLETFTKAVGVDDARTLVQRLHERHQLFAPCFPPEGFADSPLEGYDLARLGSIP